MLFHIRRLFPADGNEYFALRMEGLYRCPSFFSVAPEDEFHLSSKSVADRLDASFTLSAFVDGVLSGILQSPPSKGENAITRLYCGGCMYVKRNQGTGSVKPWLRHAPVRSNTV